MTKINPYLLGILLSDSSFTDKEKIRISMSNNMILDVLKNLIESDVIINYGGSSPNYGKFYNLSFIEKDDNELKNALKKFKLLGVKDEDLFIPEDIKKSDKSDKISFLLGLLDGEGSMTTTSKIGNDKILFYSYSKQFYKDLDSLIKSIGGKTIKKYLEGNFEINIFLPFPISLYCENNKGKMAFNTGMPK